MKVDRSLFVTPAVFLVMLASVPHAEATEEPLVTDRPDITESAAVVGHGLFQIETSGLYERTEEGSAEETVFATPTLLRVGLGDYFEVRFSGDFFTQRALEIGGSSIDDSGVSPVALGAKVRIARGGEEFTRPGLALLAQTELPSGSGPFKVRRATGQVLLLADSDINEVLGVGVNVGAAAFETSAEKVETGGLFSVALGYGITDEAGAFIEFAGSGLGLAGDDQLLVLDAGLTYLFGPNMQVDVAGGFGLNDASVPDAFATIGFSFRGPYLPRQNR